MNPDESKILQEMEENREYIEQLKKPLEKFSTAMSEMEEIDTIMKGLVAKLEILNKEHEERRAKEGNTREEIEAMIERNARIEHIYELLRNLSADEEKIYERTLEIEREMNALIAMK